MRTGEVIAQRYRLELVPGQRIALDRDQSTLDIRRQPRLHRRCEPAEQGDARSTALEEPARPAALSVSIRALLPAGPRRELVLLVLGSTLLAVAIGIVAFLLVFFGARFMRSKKVMPAGMMSVVSLVVLILLLTAKS